MKTDKVIFNGSCLTCESQEKYGKGRCTYCMYFEGDWSLPDLNTVHFTEHQELLRKRNEFKNYYKLN